MLQNVGIDAFAWELDILYDIHLHTNFELLELISIILHYKTKFIPLFAFRAI